MERIYKNPIEIFLIDCIGAFLTAILLGLVLLNFQEYFGMPSEILIPLASIAMVFCIYSLSCYLLLKRNWKPYLKIIALANLLYCAVTATLLLVFYSQLTILGVLYFIGEIVMVLALVYFEFKLLKSY